MSYPDIDERICRDCERAYIREHGGSTEYCPDCQQSWQDVEDDRKIQAARDAEL